MGGVEPPTNVNFGEKGHFSIWKTAILFVAICFYPYEFNVDLIMKIESSMGEGNGSRAANLAFVAVMLLVINMILTPCQFLTYINMGEEGAVSEFMNILPPNVRFSLAVENLYPAHHWVSECLLTKCY